MRKSFDLLQICTFWWRFRCCCCRFWIYWHHIRVYKLRFRCHWYRFWSCRYRIWSQLLHSWCRLCHFRYFYRPIWYRWHQIRCHWYRFRCYWLQIRSNRLRFRIFSCHFCTLRHYYRPYQRYQQAIFIHCRNSCLLWNYFSHRGHRGHREKKISHEVTRRFLRPQPKKWCRFFRLKYIVMIWFTDAAQNFLAKKTRNWQTVLQRLFRDCARKRNRLRREKGEIM